MHELCVSNGPVLVKTLDYLFVNDGEGKPVGIHEFIGRRPIACFGNSDGDKAMLEYTTIANPRPSLGLIVHHTDDQHGSTPVRRSSQKQWQAGGSPP